MKQRILYTVYFCRLYTFAIPPSCCVFFVKLDDNAILLLLLAGWCSPAVLCLYDVSCSCCCGGAATLLYLQSAILLYFCYTAYMIFHIPAIPGGAAILLFRIFAPFFPPMTWLRLTPMFLILLSPFCLLSSLCSKMKAG